jgi:acyl transferase domain-containing protein
MREDMKKSLLNINQEKQGVQNHYLDVSFSEILIKDIAIIGISCKTSLANNSEELWNNIRNKVDCIRQFPANRRADISQISGFCASSEDNYYTMGYLDEIDMFDCNFFGISPKEASLMDPNQRLFLEEAWKAIEDAGYGGDRLKGSRTGVFVGFGGETNYMKLIEKFEPANISVAFPGNLNSIIASRISYLLDLKGPSMVIDTACSSSLVAVHLACQAIKAKECSMALVGGIKIHMIPLDTGTRIGIESSDNRTKAFDESSDGTGSGEGVAVVLLKPLPRAFEDGDHIYAVIKGSSVNQDGTSIGLTAPNPIAQEDVITRAWKEGNVNPQEISYIEAHGTGTRLGDPIEIEAIKKAFGRYTNNKQFCAVSSLKTNIGHLDYAAGIFGLVKTAMAINKKEIPPTIHFNMPNKKISFIDSPIYINDRLLQWETPPGVLRKCGVSSFGMSGTNCHIVLEEFPQKKSEEPITVDKMHVFTLSAKSEISIYELVMKYKEFVKNMGNVCLENICYTANIGRGHYNYRLAIIVEDVEDLKKKIEKFDWKKRNEVGKKDFFYGKHKIIPDKKNTREAGDIKEKELNSLNRLVNSRLEKYIIDGFEDKDLLREVCSLYVNGGQVKWSLLYRKANIARLPTYPFERKRCWVQIPQTINPVLSNSSKKLFYSIKWKRADTKIQGEEVGQGSIVIFNDNKGKADIMASKLRENSFNVIEVNIGIEFRKISDNSYITSVNYDDYKLLLEDIYKKNIIAQIIHMQTIKKDQRSSENILELNTNLEIGVYSLFFLVKALITCPINGKLSIVLITQYADEVTGDESMIIPENAALIGFGKVIGIENSHISCRAIDIDEVTNPCKIIDEIKYKGSSYKIAFRNGVKYSQEIDTINISRIKNNDIKIIENGVYIITGGAGGLGLEIGRFLATKAKVNLILINRSDISHRMDLDRWFVEIEKLNSIVYYYKADISCHTEIEAVLDEVRYKMGKINGIIHCAGVAGDGFLINKKEKMIKEVLAPKVSGTLMLDSLTRNDNLDFFVTFSSITSFLGAYGQSDYTAANAYLDSFARYRNKNGRKTLNINWTAWKDTGMAKNAGVADDGIFKVIPTQDAISAFESVLDKDLASIIIGEFNYNNTMINKTLFQISLSSNMEHQLYSNKNLIEIHDKIENNKDSNKKILIKGKKITEEYTKVETEIANSWGKILGIDEININDDFFELGGNSIMALKFESDMEMCNINLKLSHIYEYRTIFNLASYIESELLGNKNKVLNGYHIERNLVNFNTICEIKLNNIEPFNDLFYKSCFYNSLFPAIKYFTRDIYPFLINDINVYRLNYCFDKIKICSSEYISLKTYEQLLNEAGLLCKHIEISANIIDDIRESINRNNPVIIWVDCYYEPIRQDIYLNEHLLHTWLIYGYNDVLKYFNIIEHNYRDNLDYKKQIINYDDAILCYNGCIDNFISKTPFPSFIEIYINQHDKKLKEQYRNLDEYKNEYKSNIIKYKDKFFESLENIKLFTEDYKNSVTDIQLLNQISESLIAGFNAIINAKKIQLYILNRLFYDNPVIIKILENIVDNWEGIRSIILKFSYTSIYKQKMLEQSIISLDEIYKLEHEFFASIM